MTSAVDANGVNPSIHSDLLQIKPLQPNFDAAFAKYTSEHVHVMDRSTNMVSLSFDLICKERNR